ncbi:hypothetical protein B0H13DRAFT_1880905 [Mycena leptocephala]|nr:hypothetical protein B0H13DRAFT_1880905 [Mycena leptocephala]
MHPVIAVFVLDRNLRKGCSTLTGSLNIRVLFLMLVSNWLALRGTWCSEDASLGRPATNSGWKYAGHGPGISFGGFWTGNVPLAQGGTLQVPWNALQEIWGSRTRNFIRRIADPECSTRAGPCAASAVERTAVNTAASPLNARRDDAGMGRNTRFLIHGGSALEGSEASNLGGISVDHCVLGLKFNCKPPQWCEKNRWNPQETSFLGLFA